MSDHDIIPPVHMSNSDSLQARNQSKQKDKKKKRQDNHPRTEPKATGRSRHYDLPQAVTT